MATTRRPVRAMPDYPPLDQIGVGVDGAQVAPSWVPVCWPPGGMDLTSAPNTLGPGRCETAVNLVPWPDSWRQRPAATLVGTAPAANTDITSRELIYARQVVDAEGREWLLRWHTAGVEVLVNGVWTACTGPAVAMTRYTQIAMTGWGNLVVWSDGASGQYALNPALRTYTAIAGAPPAQHLTTFARRIVASVSNTSRVQWCVAGDYTDWTSTDLGAGYEDLLSAPDGTVDRQTAVLPISDEVAYCVRSNSLWQMEPTRVLEAPFAFSRVLGTVGSRWPATCTTVPGGIAFMADTGVYLFRGGQFEDLTPPIQPLFARATQAVLRSARMVYDPVAQALRLLGEFTDERFGYIQSTHLSLRWNFRVGGGWTADRYIGMTPISLTSAVDFRKRGTVGELTGTVGALTGVVGDLLVSTQSSGVLFVMRAEADAFIPNGKNWVAREEEGGQAWTPLGVGEDGNGLILLQSGALRTTDAGRVTHVAEAHLVVGAPGYISGTGTTLLLCRVFSRGQDGFSGGSDTLVTVQPANTRQRRYVVPLSQATYAAQFRMTTVAASTSPLYFYDLRARVADGAIMGDP